jgi:hypothetical protein
MREFIKKIAILLALPAVVVCCVNYFVDPAKLYRNVRNEGEIARHLLEGSNVASVANYDERLIQKHYIDGLSKKKDIVVLGSSRSKMIGSELFHTVDFFNNSVSAASLEDYMALYWMYRKRGIVPSNIIIGLDPWILNRNNNPTGYKSIEADYREILKAIGSSAPGSSRLLPVGFFHEKYTSLISPSYFQISVSESLRRLGGKKSKKKDYYTTKNMFEKEGVLLSDGSLTDTEEIRSLSVPESDAKAIEYANVDPVYCLGNFTRLDPEAIERLSKFIDLLQRDGIEVLFYLPPYHPRAYDILTHSDKYNIISDAQRCFENMARYKMLRLVGSYNPIECNLADSDFYDGMHLKRESVGKVINGTILLTK